VGLGTYQASKQILSQLDNASTRNISGVSVLGKYPDYINLSGEINAKRFSIPLAFGIK